ncbi:hypothetical protein Gbro_1186 [Gordonia bronchialis DSM 43247]|uniref:Uncharacterized protein n=1 Tax=Gordonia bronchialis (strain ATCC 25592 / DSM 43247 / BCRC 13721 / JCM 3198 / KCTC 3076 / NBRC 16047 / NCTC 10667) TaxID=526226 RepID=D0L538_GORB4|nr:hypothetical protein [Gordonia bronchialis]ACY20490.1 hypothetical protein Gbro_1186 [Gordonia bronchialis DSM 43247]MCC3323259.1 hypothetical protein [Gordonia bronchialis]QGS25728.1 hypothetical protein FOB84_17920 [Gordonia bronchialis]STQ63299.1 Uncharacterised protein [Gordonia bronchialis]
MNAEKYTTASVTQGALWERLDEELADAFYALDDIRMTVPEMAMLLAVCDLVLGRTADRSATFAEVYRSEGNARAVMTWEQLDNEVGDALYALGDIRMTVRDMGLLLAIISVVLEGQNHHTKGAASPYRPTPRRLHLVPVGVDS